MIRRAVALLLLALPAAAQPQLYGPQPPTGSALVRIVNATDAPLAVRTDFGRPLSLGRGTADRVGSYAVVERVAGRALSVEAQAGARHGRATLRAVPGAFLTVLVMATAEGLALHPITDEARFNQARAHLAFYNGVPACPAASLLLDPDGPAVVTAVGRGTAGTRMVNPAAARLHAACPPVRTAVFALEGLAAGGRYSVWLVPEGEEGAAAFLTRDAVPGVWQPGR